VGAADIDIRRVVEEACWPGRCKKSEPNGCYEAEGHQEESTSHKEEPFRTHAPGYFSGPRQKEGARATVKKPSGKTSQFDSEDESVRPENDYRKVLSLSQTVTVNG
jgi:hypothetical protein